MKKRPQLFGLAALSITLTLMASIYKNWGPDTTEFQYTLLSVYWLILAFGALSAWRLRPMGHFGLTLSVTLISFIETYFVGSSGFSLSTFFGLITIGCGIFLIGEGSLQGLFYFSSRRWWETPKRHLLNAVGTIEFDQHVDQFEITNISETGCLAHSSARPPDETSVQVMLDEKLKLEAKVVRVAGDYLGLRFNFKNRKERNDLKTFIRYKLAEQTLHN